MQNDPVNIAAAPDQTAARKDSHLDLALKSQNRTIDPRFYYEPMVAAHPDKKETWEVPFGAKKMRFPIWISSMTGGTTKTNEVNKRLATMAQKFGLGMGIGSARIAVENKSKERDFSLRKYLGEEVPFYLNFGIAQIERFLKNGETGRLVHLRNNLNADGFIIHVNPIQEWMQPEGDRIYQAPITTIRQFLNQTGDIPLIVKEVGQGYGPQSMKALLELPLQAIEFAAAGGTNFARVELQRNQTKGKFMESFVDIGQTAAEMVEILNTLVTAPGADYKCQTAIISGGVKDFLDGYYYIQKAKMTAVYGHASGFLKYALLSQEALNEFTQYQIEGLLLARAFLKIKGE